MVRGGAGALTVWGSPFMQQLTKCICLPQVLKTSKILHQNKSPLIAGMCALKLPAEGAKRQSCPVRGPDRKTLAPGTSLLFELLFNVLWKIVMPPLPPIQSVAGACPSNLCGASCPFSGYHLSIWLVTCLPAHPTSPALSAPGHHATPPPPDTSQSPWHCA